MDYTEFLGYVLESITTIMGEESQVTVRKVLKNNDIELDALTITEQDSNISPTIYLNPYYEEYLKGRSPGDIISEITNLYEEHKGKLLFDINYFRDFKKIKRKVVFKLINYAANDKLLSDVPYVRMLDLAVVFYCLIDSEFMGSATALIHTLHMEMWNTTVEELYELAKVNTPRLLGMDLRNMNDIMKDMFQSELKEICNSDYTAGNSSEEDMRSMDSITDQFLMELRGDRSDVSMYVLTNRLKLNGASCILYQDVLADFAKEQGRDLYILPSSIHEVILIPAYSIVSEDELTNMVQEVNEEEVDAGDQLSDHIYIFRLETGQICM